MMRMPFYAYQNQSPETAERPRLSVMTALAVGATILLYVGLLAFVLLRGQ